MGENEDYLEKSGQIRELAALPPEELTQHLSNTHNTLDAIAPTLATHVYSSAANAIHFLNSKLPNMGNELIQDKLPTPSRAQQEMWLNLHSLVDNPLSVLEHVNNGTVNNHHIEALQTVFPELHQEMIQKSIEELGKLKMNKTQLPYYKRVAISKFIGQPLDSTLTPQGMQSIIKAAGPNQGPEAQQAQGGPKRESQGALREVDQANQLDPTNLQARQIQKRK